MQILLVLRRNCRESFDFSMQMQRFCRFDPFLLPQKLAEDPKTHEEYRWQRCQLLLEKVWVWNLQTIVSLHFQVQLKAFQTNRYPRTQSGNELHFARIDASWQEYLPKYPHADCHPIQTRLQTGPWPWKWGTHQRHLCITLPCHHQVPQRWILYRRQLEQVRYNRIAEG